MMKLLKLSSDNEKFNEIEFKPGLNIIAGIQLTKAKKKTYNGIGKSFSLNLIHLMLGADLKKKTVKEKKIFNFLNDYGEFYLSFEHKGKNYFIKKRFSQSYYHLNEVKLSKKEFKLELDRIFIPINSIHAVSFRQAFNCIARRFGGKYYADALTQQGMLITDYKQRLVNLWYLRVGAELAIEKNSIKSELEKISKARKALELTKNKEQLESVKDLKDLLQRLKKSKENFEIGSEYDHLKSDADTLTSELHEIRSSLSLVRADISLKKLNARRINLVDIDVNDVRKIYEEAKFFFPDQVNVQFERAAQFHENLTKGRMDRINEDILALEKKSKKLKEILNDIESKRDSILSILNDMSAFKEYDSINNAIISSSNQIENFEKYSKVINELETKESGLIVDNAEINNRGRLYLNDNKSKIEDLENQFREIVKTFYDNHGGNLNIDLSKDAKYLFDLDVHIPRDASQGVNEVKVFCYDLLLYRVNKGLFDFLAHDGYIFSELDPRQKAMMFKNILHEVNSSDLQYFVNLGQSSIDEILSSDILNEDEKIQIEQSIRLRLYDNDVASWLFGESFG